MSRGIKGISTKLFVIFVLILLLIKLIAVPYVVNGESMEPTLHNRDIGLGIKTTMCDINRWDIVIIDTEDKKIIKRVIGLPGEKIVYENGVLLINDSIIMDEFGLGKTSNFEVKLTNNEYFCLGDNREHSSDSRIYGPFTNKDIVAKSILESSLEFTNKR